MKPDVCYHTRIGSITYSEYYYNSSRYIKAKQSKDRNPYSGDKSLWKDNRPKNGVISSKDKNTYSGVKSSRKDHRPNNGVISSKDTNTYSGVKSVCKDHRPKNGIISFKRWRNGICDCIFPKDGNSKIELISLERH